MSELRNCPFCGNEFNAGHKENCYFRVRGKSDEAREKSWQNRPIEDALRAELKTANACYDTAVAEGKMHLENELRLQAENERLREAMERKDDALHKIKTWSEAYPYELFPQPDMAKARELLEDGGMLLDNVSAYVMRKVVDGVRNIAVEALQPQPPEVKE